MKTFRLFLVVVVLVTHGCDRNPSSVTSVDHASAGPRSGERYETDQRGGASRSSSLPASVPTPTMSPETARAGRPLTKSELQALAQVLAISKTDTDEIKQRKIDKVITLLPQLKKAGLFWTKAGAIPASHQDLFRNEILTELRKLKPTPGTPLDPWFREAHLVANRLRESEVARIALEHLPLVPVYRFPAAPPREGWPDDPERLAHGDQGIVAATVVDLGDSQTLAQFREMVRTAEPDAQRTLIWALGRSTALEDFEFLMGLRGTLAKQEAEDTLVRALNRIPQEMQSAGKNPESIPGHRSKDTETLLKNAAACKARLEAAGLVVELSFYD